jgi:hypothetical protein
VQRTTLRAFTAVAAAIAVGLAVGVSPFAASSPDGLERVADDGGFLEKGALAPVQEGSPVPDYAFPGIEDPRVATGVAGFVGTLATFAIAYGITFALRRTRGPREASGAAPGAT